MSVCLYRFVNVNKYVCLFVYVILCDCERVCGFVCVFVCVHSLPLPGEQKLVNILEEEKNQSQPGSDNLSLSLPRSLSLSLVLYLSLSLSHVNEEAILVGSDILSKAWSQVIMQVVTLFSNIYSQTILISIGYSFCCYTQMDINIKGIVFLLNYLILSLFKNKASLFLNRLCR